MSFCLHQFPEEIDDTQSTFGLILPILSKNYKLKSNPIIKILSSLREVYLFRRWRKYSEK